MASYLSVCENPRVNGELQAQWEQVEKSRVTFVERVRTLPAEKQSTRPGPKEFSPIEVVMHLALSEKFDLDLIDKDPPAALSGLRAKPRFVFRFVLRTLNKARRVPAMAAMTPTGDVSLEEADRKWAEVREQLRGHLESLQAPGDPVMKHPMFGLCSGKDLLDLLSAHQVYHDVRFPKV